MISCSSDFEIDLALAPLAETDQGRWKPIPTRAVEMGLCPWPRLWFKWCRRDKEGRRRLRQLFYCDILKNFPGEVAPGRDF